jgi:hypothetical protein
MQTLPLHLLQKIQTTSQAAVILSLTQEVDNDIKI